MGIIDWALNKFGYTKLDRAVTPAGIIEKEFGVRPAASRKMEDNIGLWWSLYTDHPPWETCEVRPLGIPWSIGRELARHALTEFSLSISGSARGEYINQNIQTAAAGFGEDLEKGLCLGGIALKPYSSRGRIMVDAFTTKFTPTRFDGTGRAIGGVFESEPVRQGKEWFIKLEYHDFVLREDGTEIYVVENRAFRSGQNGGIGAPVPLKSVGQWKNFSEREEIERLEGPLFAYFKPPGANHIDPVSPLGVSVYAGANIDLLEQADTMWERLQWEYASAERKVLLDRSAVEAGQASDRLFEYGTFQSADFFQFLNPEIRDDPFYHGFQRVLQRIEFNVGLAYGTISDPQSVEKTATEILAAKQRQFVTEKAVQSALQTTLDGLIYAMDALCDLYRLAPAGTYSVDYNWGDGVLDDPETKRQDMAMGLSLLNASIIGPVEYRMRYFGEDEETAREMLPDMEDMTTEPEEEIE